MPHPSALIRRPHAGFGRGHVAITRAPDAIEGAAFPLGLDFGVVNLAAGEVWQERAERETAWVLLDGAAEIECEGIRAQVARASLFDEPPTALHLPAGAGLTIRARAPTEFAVIRAENPRTFAPRLFRAEELKPEFRGTGLVQNAALRNVRLIFDQAARPESNLVVGEVVNYPGRWSSYPPHHHDQPEIYHYRFTAPDGYGHAELGDEVVKVRDGDTTVIPPGRDHAQVSAPGYGMYYLWMIRHLPGNPYTGFTFTAAHRWTLDPQQQGWRPRTPPPGL